MKPLDISVTSGDWRAKFSRRGGDEATTPPTPPEWTMIVLRNGDPSFTASSRDVLRLFSILVDFIQ